MLKSFYINNDGERNHYDGRNYKFIMFITLLSENSFVKREKKGFPSEKGHSNKKYFINILNCIKNKKSVFII